MDPDGVNLDLSLFDYDAGYYEYTPGKWLSSKPPPRGFKHWGPDVVAKAVAVELDDSDTLVATVMKTGTTWTMAIIRLLMQIEDLDAGKDPDFSAYFKEIPFLEMVVDPDGTTGADCAVQQTPPRYLKTHLPYHMFQEQLEKHPNIKVIQTLRNPKDALVSCYHHFMGDLSFGGFNGTWDQFFEIVKAKKLPWGDFFEINAEWYKFNKNRDNSLVVRYEDLKKDHRGQVVKIAKFLGFDLTERQIDIVTKYSAFKYAQGALNNAPAGDWRKEKSVFIRKGEVGDWVNYFTPEQSEYVEARTREILEPLGITFEY